LKMSLTSVHVLLSNPRWRRPVPDPIIDGEPEIVSGNQTTGLAA